MKSEEYKRGYDAGYRAAAVDIAIGRGASLDVRKRRLGGPDSPFKPRGIPGSIYNDPGDEPFHAISDQDIIR